MTTKRTVLLSFCLAAAILMTVVAEVPAWIPVVRPCEMCTCSDPCTKVCEELDVGPSTCGASGNLCVDSPECACYCSVTIGGTSGNDTLNGTSNNDCIFGYDGHDTIYGHAGHDEVTAGSGNDTVEGGSGDDCLYGGSGADYLDGGSGSDTCTSGSTYVSCE